MIPALNVGLIGYGYAGATFHAPLIDSVPGLRLTAVASSDPARVHAALPQVAVEPGPDALLARTDIDLVVIATPNRTHYPLAAAALAAGRHVVVDKPFTLTTAEAGALIEAARQAGRMLSVFHNRRWDSDFLTLQSVLAAGTLGRPVHFESRFDRYRPAVRVRWRESAEPGAGLWYDLGPHLVDQAVQLFGAPDAIGLDRARVRDGAESDDWFVAVLQYPQRRAVLRASTLAADAGPRLALHGTGGSFARYGLDPQEAALKAGRRPADPDWGQDPEPAILTLPDGDGFSRVTLPCLPGDYRRYYAGVRAAIAGEAPVPVTGDQALTVMRIIEAGCRADAEGRRVSLKQE